MMKILPAILSSFLLLTIPVDVTNGSRYEEIGGRHQGDMVLTDIQSDAATGGGTPIVQESYKWAKGVVPFVIDGMFNKSQVEVIVQAMGHISTRSCVRFVSHAKQPQYLNITGSPTGCWATLGMNLLSNQLNLDPEGCIRKGEIIHQLLHVLGLTHPQSRPDRDIYVLVQLDAIDPKQWPNLEKYHLGTNEDFGMPYDYESILHCQSDAFGATTSTRSSVVPLANVNIGQREELSLKDVRNLNRMYEYEFCGFCVRGNCHEIS